jgi:hypothetical protein
MKTKHTKKDWKLYRNPINGENEIGTLLNNDTEYDRAICSFVNTRYDEEGIANQKLIAAAPEMLEALQELYDFTNNYFGGSMAGKIARNNAFKAIKKATE